MLAKNEGISPDKVETLQACQHDYKENKRYWRRLTLMMTLRQTALTE